MYSEKKNTIHEELIDWIQVHDNGNFSATETFRQNTSIPIRVRRTDPSSMFRRHALVVGILWVSQIESGHFLVFFYLWLICRFSRYAWAHRWLCSLSLQHACSIFCLFGFVVWCMVWLRSHLQRNRQFTYLFEMIIICMADVVCKILLHLLLLPTHLFHMASMALCGWLRPGKKIR